MNCKPVLFLLCFNLIYLALLHSGECFRFVGQHEVMQPAPVFEQRVMARQAPFISSILAGPLALATFLFALPLLPSLVMAPLALAGIPPALNVLSTLVNSVGSGKPLNSILSTLSDPLQAISSDPSSAGDNQAAGSSKPLSGLAAQLDSLRSIARMFRAAISRRNTIHKNVAQENALVPDKVQEDIEGLELSLNGTSPTNSSLSAVEMEKSIRAMDAVFTSIRDVYSVIRNGLRRYEITDSDCQSRIVCEIHQKIISRNKMLKTFSLNAIDVLSLEKHVDSWSTLNEKSKRTIKFYINAAKVGFADKDCTKEFENCPTLSKRSLVMKSIMFGRNLFGKL